MDEPANRLILVCSAHAEVILAADSSPQFAPSLLRTRGGDPSYRAADWRDEESAPHTRR